MLEGVATKLEMIEALKGRAENLMRLAALVSLLITLRRLPTTTPGVSVRLGFAGLTVRPVQLH
jgi:hypothetical protein